MAGAARSSLCLCKNFGKLSICKRNGRGCTVITLPLQEVRRLTVKVNGRTSPKVSAKIYCKQRLHLFDKTWTEVMATSTQVDEQEGRNNPSNLLRVTLTLRKKVETSRRPPLSEFLLQILKSANFLQRQSNDRVRWCCGTLHSLHSWPFTPLPWFHP